MKKYPSQLVDRLHPLVFMLGPVEGEPDIHTRLIASFEVGLSDVDASIKEATSPIKFRVVPLDYAFLQKKRDGEVSSLPLGPLGSSAIVNSSATLSTSTSSSESSLSPSVLSMTPSSSSKGQVSLPCLDGILQSNWMGKYHERLPSVIVYTIPFSVDWSPGEWNRRESFTCKNYNNIKFTAASGRVHLKIIVIAIKTGAGNLEKDVLDERLSSLKKQLQLDSKTFILLAPNEIASMSPSMKVCSKNLRDFATAYYTSYCKQIRSKEKMLLKSPSLNDNILLARYSYKIAYIYEFLAQQLNSLKYYKQCERVLIDLLQSPIDEEWTDQIKHLAEYAHVKIVRILLGFSKIDEAYSQFQLHIKSFMKVYSFVPWTHYAWLSDQYVVFAQLLDLYYVSNSTVVVDKSFYYQNAARFASKRQASYLRMQHRRASGSSSESDGVAEKYASMVNTPPKYIGALPKLVDPTSIFDPLIAVNDELAEKLVKHYFEDQENQFSHLDCIITLLTCAYQAIPTSHNRRKAHVCLLFADQYLLVPSYTSALEYLNKGVCYLFKEGWIDSCIPIFRKIMTCTFNLGLLQEYVVASFSLYSIANKNFLSRNEKEELNKCIISSMLCTQGNAKCDLSLLSNYALYATDKALAQCKLPSGFKVQVPKSHRVFDITVKYEKNTLEILSSLRISLSIKSKLYYDVTFSEVHLHFTNDCIVKRLVLSSALAAADQDAVKVDSLTFPPDRVVTFDIDVFITEACLVASTDTYICIENASFILPTHESVDGGSVTDIVVIKESALSLDLERVKEECSVKSLGDLPARGIDIIHVTRPKSSICLEYPPIIDSISTIRLLQGPIQRVNIVFSTDTNEILNGRVFLSSDIIPTGTSSSLFWYPILDQLASSPSACSANDHSVLDAVVFHPFLLSSSMQPLQPIILPNMPHNSLFTVPLFIRSENYGTYKVRLCIEYYTSSMLAVPVVKEFEVSIVFERPLKMSYNMTSHKDALCGLTKEKKGTFVISGDTINMASSLSCINSLHSQLGLVSIAMHANVNNKLFQVDTRSSNNLLFGRCSSSDHTDHRDTAIKLQTGEIYVGSIDVLCIPSNTSGNISEQGSSESMGSLYVDWRFVDDNFFNEMDLSRHPMAAAEGRSICHVLDASSVNNQWLYRLGDNTIDALDVHTVACRVCSMVFEVPPVQILDAPFDVSTDIPSLAHLGKDFILTVHVYNKLQSLERLVVNVEMNEYFVVTGCMSGIVVVRKLYLYHLHLLYIHYLYYCIF